MADRSTTTLPLLGGALVVDDEVIELLIARLAEDDQLAERVAARLADHGPQPNGWLTVDEAAEYRGCPVSRIYDLKAQGRLEHRKDGRKLYFRREWLDDAFADA